MKSSCPANSRRELGIFSTETPPTRLLKHLFRILQSTNVKKSTNTVKKKQRAVTAAEAKQYTAAEKNACLSFVASAKNGSLEAMLNGGICEACQ